ncbi:MAG: hypothetical protein WAW96_19325 [Alphaproteobacteria bacterium]
MDRAQLKYLLNSGPSRILDVRKLHFEQKLVPLFKCGILNSTILIKQSAGADLSDYDELPPIATKVYLPYDRKRPEEGGESFFFTPGTLRNAITNILGERNVEPESLAADTELLSLFGRIPSFSPYLMKDVLERANLVIPDGYFTLPPRESAMIKQRMRARLRPLVATAFAGQTGKMNETSIERLVQKLWELSDMKELMPLVHAFRITPEAAPEVFYCWLGIAFFENEYIKLQPRLKKLATWMSSRSNPRDILPRGVLDHYRHSIMRVRKLLQQHWKTSLGILQQYTSTYDDLVGASGSAKGFIEFLRQSKSHFWTLGGCLGRLEQSVEIWDQVCGRTNYEIITYERGVELFGILNLINTSGADTAEAALDAEIV